ncbi:hypothetical protein C8R41DRAFT_843006 [Lentinula lateritia]|uniref:Uncharacterized protein n=1 Tax=Lentinula lateritia TaxID=40482 RepID=A0ABQ8V8N2_9AGAR|nr:hypothetical protein C8R41DRAFT_843006 [Lentinula lateritia]
MATAIVFRSRPSIDSLQKTLPTKDRDIWASNEGIKPKPLPAKFAELKKHLVKPEDYHAVQASWDRLLVALEQRVKEIENKGPTVSD